MIKVKQLYQQLDKTNNKTERLDLLYRLGKLLISKDPIKAREVVQELSELAAQEKNDKYLAYAMLMFGNLNFATMQLEDAEEYINKSLSLLPEDHEGIELPRAKMALGLLYWVRGDHVQAIDTYKPLLSVDGDTDEFYAFKADLLTNIGNVYAHKGDIEDAETYYKHALQVLLDADMHDESYHIRGNLAAIEGYKSNYKAAIDQLLICLEGYKRLGNKQYTAVMTVNLAIAYSGMKLYAEALDMYQKGLKLFKALNDNNTIISVYTGMARVYLGLKGYEEALEYATKSLDMATHIGFPRGILDAMIVKGHVLVALNKKEDARTVYNKALELAETKGLAVDTEVGNSLEELLNSMVED